MFKQHSRDYLEYICQIEKLQHTYRKNAQLFRQTSFGIAPAAFPNSFTLEVIFVRMYASPHASKRPLKGRFHASVKWCTVVSICIFMCDTRVWNATGPTGSSARTCATSSATSVAFPQPRNLLPSTKHWHSSSSPCHKRHLRVVAIFPTSQHGVFCLENKKIKSQKVPWIKAVQKLP